MKIEEEITCEYCESEFTITYDDNSTYGKLTACPFCAEHLDDPDDEEDDDDNFLEE